MSYYFLGSLITPIHLDAKPSLTWTDYKALLEATLSKSDLRQMRRVLHYFDLENLQLYQRGEPITIFGNWSLTDIEQLTLHEVASEPWLDPLLNGQQPATSEQNLRAQAHFFEEELKKTSTASKVLRRIWQTKWASAFFRARLLGQHEALLEEPGADHPLIEELMDNLQHAQLEVEYQKFKNIFDNASYDIEALSRAALEWQMDYLGQGLESYPFSLENLLVYLVQLAWTERWQMRQAPANWDPEASTLAALT